MFSLPIEIRNNIYEQLLVHEAPIVVGSFIFCARQRPGWNLNLESFFINKTIYDEAMSVFYSRNTFSLTNHVAEAFITFIGPRNASSLRHIWIDFPDFGHLNLPDDFTFRRLHAHILERIKSECTGLHTLTMVPCPGEGSIHRFHNDQIAAKASAMIDTKVRSIPSLKNIIVKGRRVLPKFIPEEMEKLGWKVK